MSNNKAYAGRLLGYYMRTIAKASGVNWDGDCDTEVREITEVIFAEIDSLRNEVEKLKTALQTERADK